MKPFAILSVLEQNFEVIDQFVNRNVRLLQLNESVKFNDEMRPACLSQPQSIISPRLTEICWVSNSWLNKLKLKVMSNTRCNTNSGDYYKSLSIQGVENVVKLCMDVESGDRDLCNVRTPFDFIIIVYQMFIF